MRKEDVETAGREIRSKVYVPCRNFDRPLPHLFDCFKLDFSSNYHGDNDADVSFRSSLIERKGKRKSLMNFERVVSTVTVVDELIDNQNFVYI